MGSEHRRSWKGAMMALIRDLLLSLPGNQGAAFVVVISLTDVMVAFRETRRYFHLVGPVAYLPGVET